MRNLVGRSATALLVTIVLVVAALPTVGAAPPRAGGTGFTWPLAPRPHVLRAFDPPEHDWLPGHRGVDLAGVDGQYVLAAGEGIVVFAGTVAGKPVVSIDHPSGLRTTYEPARAATSAGTRVGRGDVIGLLEAEHPGCDGACLHWGVRRGREYLDPTVLVERAPVRLKPLTS
ncbi:M23 family metallopeptidase [Rhodococcoides fascians]|uniref:M23 family metallopeptidase n=1 Tax=Rhodococcoides fascians TaxID=1828 RepID=UPI0005649D81|nr:MULTISPECIES: M23 family metallopeptidase [Rhodococcus]OZE94757.1 peptidase [Rhodococcus sp. 15-1189-1-1a]OZF09068.1 peptidase [Rhodococcus sp. 14-2686-1-2]